MVGVLGLERLFGKKAMSIIAKIEKERVETCISQFLAHGGAVIALQKDAFNSISQNRYDLSLAVEGKLQFSTMTSLFTERRRAGGFIRIK